MPLQRVEPPHVSLEYRPAIDGLRAIAVLGVFIFHLNHAWLGGGFVGVDVFFVISGYLITSIILKDCVSDSFSLRRFYQRRIARITPAFFSCALFTLAGAAYFYSPQDLASAGVNFSAAVLSVANIKFMLQGSYFELSPDAQPFLHYWSLSIEEQFYLFFPVLVVVLFKYGKKSLVVALSILCAGSFLASVVLIDVKPVWAFYLLPTRAWELIAGCLVAVLTDQAKPSSAERWPQVLSVFSLGLLAVSFWVVKEGNGFPGYWALLPVIGAVGLVVPVAGRTVGERFLATAPLVSLGRISYSLYLWHWPIFSFVDYRMYLASEPCRLALKVCLSFLAAVLSFWCVENPLRHFLNRGTSRSLVYASLLCILAMSVPLGIAVRKANYVNAAPDTVSAGGLVFEAKPKASSVVLMGDSNGSMYGKLLKDVCAELGCKLSVISVAGGDPLPAVTGASSQLWLDSLATVQRERPECLVLACNWASKLKGSNERLTRAIEALKPFVGRLVIINQIPILPMNANRAAMREGIRPPFFEDVETRRARTESNDYLRSFETETCMVIDMAAHLQATTGEVFFLDKNGRQLYADRDHLSSFGTELIREDLQRAIAMSHQASGQ